MPSLGPETRRRFWKYCVPNADQRGQPQEASQLWDQVVMWNGAVFEKRRRALERFWETGEVGEEEEERGRRSGRRREAFVVAAVNEGAVSLRMLLPGGMEEVRERLEGIRERVGGMEESDVWVLDEGVEDEEDGEEEVDGEEGEEEEEEEGGYWGGIHRDLVLLASTC